MNAPGYLDTTLWEIGGRHLSTDHPSGRTVKFRKTKVFDTPAIVRYLVEPREAGRVRTRLVQRILEALNAEPERALFPKSNMR